MNMNYNNASIKGGSDLGGKNIQYFDLLKKALLVTWKNKFLWIFGLFVSLGTLGSNLNMRSGENASTEKEFQFLTTFMSAYPKVFMILSGVLIFLMIVFFFLRIIGTAAIIKSVSDLNLYRQLGFVGIFKEAKSYFWKIFLLEMLLGLSLGIIVMLLAIPTVYLFALNAKALGYFALVAAFFIAIPLLVLVYYLGRYGKMYIVMGKTEIRFAIESAYATFAQNIKPSLLMGLISMGLEIFLLVAVITLCLVLALALAPFALAAYFLFAKIGALAILVPGIFLAIVLILSLFSWYETFLQAVWVFFFQEIVLEKNNELKKEEEIDPEVIPTPEVV